MDNKKYLKIKLKSYKGKLNKKFHDTEMPKESSHCICLLVILTDSVFDMGNPQKRCRQIYQ